MNHSLSWKILCLLTLLPTLAAAQAPTGSPAQKPLFPTAVGSRWTYDSNGVEVVEEIIAEDVIQGETCQRVITKLNGKVLSFEHLVERPDGMYRVTIAGEPMEPPLCFLKTHAESGETWAVDSKIGEVSVTGEFTAGTKTESTADIKASGSTSRAQQAITSHGSKFRVPQGELEFTYEYVPGIGKVRQSMTFGDKTKTLVLKKFEPGTGTTASPGKAGTPPAGAN
jgi:hypothetical protein